MRCEEYKERIALLAGGELPEREREDVERHLAECAECRELVEELGGIRGLLVELSREAAPEETLEQVRIDVRRRLANRSQRWLWAAAAAAAAVVVAVGVEWLNRADTVPPPPLVVRAPEAPPLLETIPAPEVSPAPEAPVMRESASVREPVSPDVPVQKAVATTGPREPLVVKFLTDDPDIVIYWIAEQTGG